MKRLRQIYRLTLLLIHLAVGLTVAATLLRGSDAMSITSRKQRIIARWLTRAGYIVGLRITTRSTMEVSPPTLVAANHISWLDILVLASCVPASFVAKSEIRGWPVIGWLATRAGTVFIERGGRNAAASTAEQITWHLKRGRSIIIFPEATISTGETVKRFYPRLFSAAVHAECAVQPVALCYAPADDGRAVAPFIDQSLLHHALQVMGEKELGVEVTFCPQLNARAVDRDRLADQAQAAISQVVEKRQPLKDHA